MKVIDNLKLPPVQLLFLVLALILLSCTACSDSPTGGDTANPTTAASGTGIVDVTTGTAKDGATTGANARQAYTKVEQAIAALSEEHRAVLVLREIDGCCYETISEMLGLPIGTVRSRLHRARLQLREQLREVLLLEE